ncbi:MAG TPA: nucleotidyltransferase domain-containing protein [Candidatus Nanoarchaeia archaeon]|nr:nucleotidyltransferase domain-containing protein [Candidatus Nanoarchaeia archaeon]
MDKVLQQIIKKAKNDPDILAVALFGSYLKKKLYNDIDICIFLVPKKYDELIISKKKLEYTPHQEKYDVQIFQQLPLYIRKRILKEAKILYQRNEDDLYDLYYSTIQQYALFEPIYEDYLKEVAHG